MPRNGSGGYALPTGINPVITQTLITSSWANVTLSDVATALTQSIAKDGQTIPTNNLPMGGFRHTGCGDPALRDNYATLGYIQDGSHYHLTGVAGVNAISATLVGGLANYSLGMIVQLQPVATSTGPVTLNINGIGAKQIVTSSGSQVTAGDVELGKAYMLMYNGTAFELLNGDDASAVSQAAMSGWDRPANGVYPVITQVNPTTINIPAGTGRIVEPSAKDTTDVTEVSWPAQNVILTNLATAWNTVIGINASGTVDQLTGNAMPAAARDHIILGSVTHMNGAIDAIRNRPSIYGDMTYGAYDLTFVFNNMLLTGGQITQNVTPMHMNLNAGVIFSLGANANQAAGPNIVPFVGLTDFSFYPISGTNGVGALTNVAPTGNYDLNGAGVIAAIPGSANATVIHRVYAMAGGVMVWLYGQQVYADQATALREFIYDSQNLKLPSKLVNATLIASIVAAKGTASLANTAECRIIPQGGNSFTIGVAGSISEAPVDGSSYGRKNAAWSKVVDAVVAGDGINVNSVDPNKPIVSVGATMAGPKTITAGDLNLSATTNINYSAVGFTVRGTSVDGADNQAMFLAGGGGAAVARGAYLFLSGNEHATGLGQATLFSGTGAQINLTPGTDVVMTTGSLFMNGTGFRSITFGADDFRLQPGTADGADTSILRLLGGGAVGSSRGASLSLAGNEHGSAGAAGLASGAGAMIDLTPGDSVRINGGRLFGTALHNNAGGMSGVSTQYIGSGTYTPGATLGANVAACNPNAAQFMRVGNVVTVSGSIQIQTTAAAGTQTVVELALPIASDFTGGTQCSGVIVGGGTATAMEYGNVTGHVANNRANITYNATATASRTMFYHYTYVVV